MSNKESSVLPLWKKQLIRELRNSRPDAKISYILPQQTGSWSVCTLLQSLKPNQFLGQISHDHKRLAHPNFINIMTIRDPAKRFESSLRNVKGLYVTLLKAVTPYEKEIRKKALRLLKDGAPLDNVVINLSNNSIRNFYFFPRYTLTDFSKGVDIFLTIQEVPEALKILLRLDYIPKLPHRNKSEKKHAPLTEKSMERIRKEVLLDDWTLWQKWTKV